MPDLSPLRMIRGSGERAVTYYSCGTIERACKDKRNIVVVKHNSKTGKMRTITTKPLMKHRRSIGATFNPAHERAGEGKFINLDAFTNDARTRIMGAQHVNPFLHGKKPYAVIVEAFKSDIGLRLLSPLKAGLKWTWADADHLIWDGRRLVGECIVASGWMTADEIWEAALKLNPELLKRLRETSSGRKDVRVYAKARVKFINDLDVIRRARCVINMRNGERRISGGATPYGLPLEQVGMAIDKAFLTRQVVNGKEVAEYHWRLVIGRREPYTLSEADWWYEDSTSEIAYLDDKIRRAAQRAA